LFLEVELWGWKGHNNIPVLAVINRPPTPIVLHVVVLLLSVLMNGAEIYASWVMLLLAPVSAIVLSRGSSWLTIVEISSLLRTDPEVYDDKKQKHLKRFHSKVVIK
jgi:hypothetical protein